MACFLFTRAMKEGPNTSTFNPASIAFELARLSVNFLKDFSRSKDIPISLLPKLASMDTRFTSQGRAHNACAGLEIVERAPP